MTNFTGKNSGFDRPAADDRGHVLDTESATIESALQQLRAIMLPRVSRR